MKTFGRILLIVAAFVLVMGITYVVVNSTNSSTTSPAFERGGEGLPQFPNGERTELPRGGGWMFGLLKNLGVMAIVVALIAVPKSLMRRKAAPVRVE